MIGDADIALTIAVAHAGRGNVSPHTDKLLPALARRGVRQTVLTWDRTRSFPQRQHIDGLEFKTLLRGGGFG
ncbi:MAG: hypothetical protein M3256_24030, partial [Actinomycetota bacterium]|nr:hypothetical protein [Actinomycetota bacterium]